MTIKSIIKNKVLLNTDNILSKDIPFIGGKARQLHTLQEIGFDVPQWAVLPTYILKQVIEEENDFIKSVINKQLKEQFDSNKKFAVRSSALQEDGIQNSFAGQFETELNISFDQLWKAITKVWDSTNSDHVKKYCSENSILDKPTMAIIIQEMLEPEVAGVGFGINPVDGDRNAKVISAVYGLGEGLVSGELNADTFIVTESIESTIVKKKFARRRTEQNGTTLIEVSKSLQNVSCLKEEQITAIVDVLDQLKNALGKAQDIEFAFENGKLFLLQTRPVTGLNKLADKNGEFILWDNSNIVESYPGVTTPLTFSFIKKTYEAAYIQIVRLFGVSEKVIENNQMVYANLLGLLKGRVYYNLVNWYRLLAQLPGFSLNAKFMENMMGVKESFDLPEKENMGKLEAWYRVVTSILKMLWSLICLPKSSKAFHKLMDQTVDRFRKIDFNKSRSDELMVYYYELENILLKRWKAPLVNDLFAMIFFGILQKLSKKHFPNHPSLHNELVAGSGDIISTQPAKQLLMIAKSIQQNPEAKKLFLNQEPQQIWDFLKKGNLKNIHQSIEDYIQKFGDRCTGELKLETITYRQDPTALIHILKSYVKQNIQEKPKSENANRDSATSIVDQELKGKWFQKRIFNYVLNKARQLVSGRENLRFERTRAFALVREMFTAIGRNWYSEGLLENPRDIFYLTQDEIFDFIKGTSVNEDPVALVKLRKKSFRNFKNEETPSERISSKGIVYHGNDFYQQTNSEIMEGDLSGIGCCPGQIRGKVQVIHHPSEIDSLNGDILVTTSTDPGWVALFPTASAILVERGSLLSHSAIVAREMGIPCIVGVNQLLKRIKTGDEVEMDGRTGEIKIIGEE